MSDIPLPDWPEIAIGFDFRGSVALTDDSTGVEPFTSASEIRVQVFAVDDPRRLAAPVASLSSTDGHVTIVSDRIFEFSLDVAATRQLKEPYAYIAFLRRDGAAWKTLPFEIVWPVALPRAQHP